MNNEITPERLKGLAQAMNHPYTWHEDCDPPTYHRTFKPNEDWELCGKLQEWLLIQLNGKIKDGLTVEFINAFERRYWIGEIYSPDLKTVWTLAGFAYVESK